MEKWKEKENLIGLTVENTMDSLEMVKRMVREHLSMQTGTNTLATSKKVRWKDTPSSSIWRK